jgi:hypothetical protein
VGVVIGEAALCGCGCFATGYACGAGIGVIASGSMAFGLGDVGNVIVLNWLRFSNLGDEIQTMRWGAILSAGRTRS